MYTRTKYQLKAIIEPRCWVRIGTFNKEWDDLLWEMLENGLITIQSDYEAVIGGVLVWIENYPYGSGMAKTHEGQKLYCSRATALYLRDQLKEALIIQRLKGPFDPLKVFEETGFII